MRDSDLLAGTKGDLERLTCSRTAWTANASFFRPAATSTPCTCVRACDKAAADSLRSSAQSPRPSKPGPPRVSGVKAA